jgi:hypothetical protein
MSWGDSWGSSPSRMHERMAKAFFEGRPLVGNKNTYVSKGPYRMMYVVQGYTVARYTPPSLRAEVMTRKLVDGKYVNPDHFCLAMELGVPANADKAVMRHLKALGVDAEFQYGGRPFLVFGAVLGPGWYTIDEAKALPKWVEPVKPPKPERFVNLTMPLFQ